MLVRPLERERNQARNHIAEHNISGYEISRLLLPPAALPFDMRKPGPFQLQRLTPKRLQGFTVTYPEGVGTCWTAKPFCTKRPKKNVGLKNPDIGLAGGFVRIHP